MSYVQPLGDPCPPGEERWDASCIPRAQWDQLAAAAQAAASSGGQGSSIPSWVPIAVGVGVLLLITRSL